MDNAPILSKKKITKTLIIQRVVPDYRIPFFDALSQRMELTIFYGDATKQDSVRPLVEERSYLQKTSVRYLFGKSYWIHAGIGRRLRSESWDAVILQPTPRCLTNIPVLMYCKFKKIKIIGWGMGEMPGRGPFKRWLHRSLQKFSVLPLDSILCYSSTAKIYYRAIGFGKRIEIAHNAVLIDEGLSQDRFVDNFEKKNKLEILFFGQITPQKRLAELINIVIEIQNLTLMVAGSGEVEYVKKLKLMAKPAASRITFLGHIPPKRLPEVSVNSDVFVLPGRGGLAINHAMALGLAVICSEGDGTEKDLVIHQVTGLKFNGDSQLRNYLVEYSQKKPELREMGLRGREHVLNKFSISKMVDAFCSVIEERDFEDT